MEESNNERRFIMIPMEVMMDDRLTLADKAVYGRAHYFNTFFESAAETAKLLGISERQVKSSKTKLEKLGLLVCETNSGHGKRYKTAEPWKESGVQNLHTRGAKIAPQTCKNCTADVQNLHTRGAKSVNIEETIEEKEENTLTSGSERDSEAEYIPELDENIHTLMIHHPGSVETVKVFGNAHVNELMEAWKDATGFDHSKIKSERYAMAGLIKQHGYEATKALVARVKRATQSNDRYAPQIARASQLRGKYSKLEALIQWERRTKAIQAEEEAKKPKEPNFAALYPTFSRANEPDTPDTPEQQAERHRVTQELRKKYGFRKVEGSK